MASTLRVHTGDFRDLVGLADRGCLQQEGLTDLVRATIRELDGFLPPRAQPTHGTAPWI